MKFIFDWKRSTYFTTHSLPALFGTDLIIEIFVWKLLPLLFFCPLGLVHASFRQFSTYCFCLLLQSLKPRLHCDILSTAQLINSSQKIGNFWEKMTTFRQLFYNYREILKDFFFYQLVFKPYTCTEVFGTSKFSGTGTYFKTPRCLCCKNHPKNSGTRTKILAGLCSNCWQYKLGLNQL